MSAHTRRKLFSLGQKTCPTLLPPALSADQRRWCDRRPCCRATDAVAKSANSVVEFAARSAARTGQLTSAARKRKGHAVYLWSRLTSGVHALFWRYSFSGSPRGFAHIGAESGRSAHAQRRGPRACGVVVVIAEEASKFAVQGQYPCM